jgi:hypothetical protein
MRHGDYKFILFFETERGELYNLRNDISEKHDLAERDPARARAMRRRLEQWLRETRAQLPTPNPNFDPARERESGPPSGPVTAK